MTNESLYEKLLKIKESVEYLKKENEGQQYNFVSSSQVIGALRKKMNEYKLLLVPEVEDARYNVVTEKTNAKGNLTVDLLTEIFITYKWVNVENPGETLKVKWYGQGVDTSGEKGTGKAYTYAEKYFLLKFFNIPTDKDDPDFFQEKQEGKRTKPKAQNSNNNDDLDIISGIDALSSTKEISEYFNKYNSLVKDKTGFVKAINARKAVITKGN